MILNLLKAFAAIILLSSITLLLLFSPSHLTTLNHHGQFSITRDSFGVPTLHVSTIEQYLYGVGSVFAEDRLFQITFRAYALQGRLSEFLGEKTLEFDRYMRQLNLKKWAQERSLNFKKNNITEYRKFSSMLQGINNRVAQFSILPLEFHLTGMKWQNFTMNHLFYLWIQLQWATSMSIFDQYTRSALLAHYTKEQIDWMLPNTKEKWAFDSIPIVSDKEIPVRVRTENVKSYLDQIKFNPLSVDKIIELNIFEFLTTADATNSWAVSGNFTESGFPLLSNDPHLESAVPTQWYLVKVNFTRQSGDNLIGAGVIYPGGLQFYGKTNYFVTGCSISHGDNQDLFREKIQGDKYLLNGEWKNLTLREETILVKTSSGQRADRYIVRETHRGPIIHYIFGALGSFNLENDTISIAWTGFNSEYESFVKITYTIFIDNINDLRESLQNGTKTYFNINILAATRDNHLLMQQTGVHPIRHNPQTGNYIKDGTTTAHDWVGIVPPEDRMHIFDPPKGYIVNANNKIAESNYYGGYLDYTIYTARADRIDQVIREEIKSGKKFNVETAKKIMMDTVDVYCRQILPEILEVVPQSKILSSFDCDFRASSNLATIYEVFMYQLYHLMKPIRFEKVSLITFHQMQQGIFNYIHFAFQGDIIKQEVMRKAWSLTFAHLSRHFESEDVNKWIWGEFHADSGRHVPFRNNAFLSKFFNLRFPGSGNFHTPNVAKMELLEFGNFDTTHKANFRAIYSFQGADWFVSDAGASENILSSHYSDQWELYQRGEMFDIFENEDSQEL